MAQAEGDGPDVAAVDLAAADSAYRPIPAFEEWRARLPDDQLWLVAVSNLLEDREAAIPDQLENAVTFVQRAAAIDTGAIEGLYEVDRGFTYTVAAQAATWETAMDERGDEVRRLFEAQLATYDLVLTAATENVPIVEAFIRRIHEVVCEPQDTHRVLVPDVGWQDAPLVKGKYKERPNHVVTGSGAVHAYAPVAETAPEMSRLVDELGTSAFREAHPVIQAAYAHYAFVAIHPFADGNGRVARALSSVYLYRGAYVPLLVFAD